MGKKAWILCWPREAEQREPVLGLLTSKSVIYSLITLCPCLSVFHDRLNGTGPSRSRPSRLSRDARREEAAAAAGGGEGGGVGPVLPRASARPPRFDGKLDSPPHQEDGNEWTTMPIMHCAGRKGVGLA